jgi:hypothetical protein
LLLDKQAAIQKKHVITSRFHIRKCLAKIDKPVVLRQHTRNWFGLGTLKKAVLTPVSGLRKEEMD